MLRVGSKLIFKKDSQNHNWVVHNATPLYTPNKTYTIKKVTNKHCYVECDDINISWLPKEKWFTLENYSWNSNIWHFFYKEEELRKKKLQKLNDIKRFTEQS